MGQPSSLRIGADSGGTFTDVVLFAHGLPVATHKLPSTPDDPGRAVAHGVEAVIAKYRAHLTRTQPKPRQVVHGSTVATNAMLEGKSARVVLITTAGFEDLLWLARQNRPDLYALEPHRQPPPIQHEDVLGLDERILADGAVLQPLSSVTIQRMIEQVAAREPQSILISLLHSYANPTHEAQVAAAIRRALPQIPLTVSSQLLPEIREYERTTTCLVNAAVAPVMARYLGDLEPRLGDTSMRIMASHGGTLPTRAAIASPVTTILSGPAGGVLGALRVAQAEGLERIITFDMGGTSTDVAMCDRRLGMTARSQIASLPLHLPMVDIHTVGAGGGSVAWIDPGGALRVGPHSTGADPGPACYGRQNSDSQADSPKQTLLPAVTDAHLVLGHLADGQPMGDGLHLNRALAQHAIQSIADPLHLSLDAAAEGVLRIADATMARAIQRVTVQKGQDVRDCTLVSFGGAGGLHACRLADMLGVPRVLCPVSPGLLSAVGMLTARPMDEVSQSIMFRGSREAINNWQTSEAIQQAVHALIERGRAALQADGVATADMQLDLQFDLRYVGQSYEITVDIPDKPAANPVDAFEHEHARLYGYRAHDRDIELVTIRLTARGPEPDWDLPYAPARSEDEPAPTFDVRDVSIGRDGQTRPYAVIERDQLRAGDVVQSRSIITEYSATTLIPPGWRGVVSTRGQILLEREASANHPPATGGRP